MSQQTPFWMVRVPGGPALPRKQYDSYAEAQVAAAEETRRTKLPAFILVSVARVEEVQELVETPIR